VVGVGVCMDMHLEFSVAPFDHADILRVLLAFFGEQSRNAYAQQHKCDTLGGVWGVGEENG